MSNAPLRLIVALSLLVPLGAAAQDNAPPAAGDPGYDGVVPGESEVRPPGAPARAKASREVYWIGFQPGEAGGSRVFVQLGREVDAQQRVTGDGELSVILPRVRLANSNAARPLDTRYFDTTLASVDARRVARRRGERGHPAGVELRFRFKNPQDAAVADTSIRKEKDGYTYLYLEFAPGSAPANEPDTAEPDAAEPSPDDPSSNDE